MKTRTLELAYEWRLNIVEVTQGLNGYPSGLYKVISGFYTYDDARVFADEVNGEVVLLSKRDGHQLWTNHGRTYEGIERAKFIDEDRYEVFDSELDFEEWCMGEIDHRMDMGFNLFEFRDMIDQMCDIYEDIRTKFSDEIAIVDIRDYSCETTDKYVTEIHDEDVTTYMIAVVDYETDEDETDEEDD